MNVDRILAIAFFVAGSVVSYILYRRGRRVKRPCVSLKTTGLIQNHIARFNGLEILYQGKAVENLAVTKVLFWNGGSDTIDRQDLVRADPLRIEALGQSRILDAKVLACNNAASQFECALSEDETNAPILFDYLDKGQGAVVQIVHSGPSPWSFHVTGSIKGVPGVEVKDLYVGRPPSDNSPRSRPDRWARRLDAGTIGLLWLVGIFGLMMFFGGVGTFAYALTHRNRVIWVEVWETLVMTVGLGGVFTGGSVRALVTSYRRLWRLRQVPRGLDVFWE